MRRIVLALAAALALGSPAAAQPDKADAVLKEMRGALGGAKLEAMTRVTLEGPFIRQAGPERQMSGTIELAIALPGRMHRSEDVEMPGGMSVERIAATDGTVAWEDTKQRGGMGGGLRVMLAGPGGRELNPEALEQARLRRQQTELSHYVAALFGARDLQASWVATAESPDGTADVLDLKPESGAAMRLFVDQKTHLPLMLQYAEVRPRIRVGGPDGGGRGGAADGGPGRAPGSDARAGRGDRRPDPDELRRRMEGMPPPAPVQVTLYLGDYKPVDGVMLPHRLTQSIEGAPAEEWTLEKIKVNAEIEPDLFEKK